MLKSLARNDLSPRLAVIGIGNELNGDDAAGVQVVRRLRQSLPENPRRMLLEAGPAPENFTGLLHRFQPDLILMVDAADMGTAPGSTAWLQPDELDGFSASTHTLPLSVLANYIKQELHCQVVVIGIQAKRLDFGQPLSEEVQLAVDHLADTLAKLLNDG